MVLKMLSKMMLKTVLTPFINSRTEIAFETEDYFIRKQSEIKKRLALRYYKEFPNCKDIACHVSLEGDPPIYVIDIDGKTLEESRKIASCVLEVIARKNWKKPFIKFSGNRGYHLLWKCTPNITLFDMKNETIKIVDELKEKTDIDIDKINKKIDIMIYSKPRLFRMPYSVHIESKKYSHFVDDNFKKISFTNKLIDIENWNFANIIHNKFEKKYSTRFHGDNITRNNYVKHKLGITSNSFIPNFLPSCIKRIENGVEKGFRHNSLFVIVSYYNDVVRLSKLEIIKKALTFNEKCRPPESKRLVINQVLHIIDNNYRFPSCKWLKENGYCLKED